MSIVIVLGRFKLDLSLTVITVRTLSLTFKFIKKKICRLKLVRSLTVITVCTKITILITVRKKISIVFTVCTNI